jgi:hypothetical protein
MVRIRHISRQLVQFLGAYRAYVLQARNSRVLGRLLRVLAVARRRLEGRKSRVERHM